MKKTIISIITTLAICTTISCTNEQQQPIASKSISNSSHLITKDSANKMIGSYIASLDTLAIQDSTALYSLIFTASELRNYLANTDVEKVKIMLAHNLDYINNGNYGKPAGYTVGAFTVVIAGIDGNGDYILDNGRAVNIAMPCPRGCPIYGNATSNLIQ